MRHTSLLAALLFGSATAAPIATNAKFSAYQDSVGACKHGSDGVIITFKDHDSRRRLTSIQVHAGDQIDDILPGIPAVTAHLSDSSIISYLDDPSVESVEADCVVVLDDPAETGEPTPVELDDDDQATGSSAQLAKSWGIDRVDSRTGVDGKYKYGNATGGASRIYILDTGVRISHQDFGGRAVAGWSAGCRTGTESGCARSWVHRGVITPGRSSCNSHGTHCASTAAGTTYGVAKNSTIVTVQVLDCLRGSGSYSGIVSGMDWAVADAKKHPNVRSVISMSLGGSGRSGVVFAAVKRAHAAGVLVVAAAGNSNSDACNYSPGGAPEAITVGSTTNSDYKSGFSSHGRCVDILAPGSSIKAAWATSDSATRTISGTSMATPHVAGAAAQLLTERPAYSTDRTTDVLKCMATKNAIKGLPSNTVNSLLFAGSAMADKAMTACVPAPPSPSPPSPPPYGSPPPPSPSPPPPTGPSPPPTPPGTTLTFDTTVPAGWDSVRPPNTFRFIRKSGRTSSGSTGPSAGYGNKGYYYYAETSSPRKPGDRFVIGYNGAACTSKGQSVGGVQFKYHMYGATMGTLRLKTDSRTLWNASGNKGNKWLDSGVVPISSPASNGGFTFEYVRGSSYTGDAAIDHVTIVCNPPVDRSKIERLMSEVEAKFAELKAAFGLWRPAVADEEVARRLEDKAMGEEEGEQVFEEEPAEEQEEATEEEDAAAEEAEEEVEEEEEEPADEAKEDVEQLP